MINILKNKIEVWKILISVCFLFVVIRFTIYEWLYIKSFSISISVIADLVTIAGILGLILAFCDYIQKRKQAKQQALVVLKSQLEVIGAWTSYNGSPYTQANREKIIRENIFWCNPFSVVFYTEDTALQNIWNLPGIVFLPEEIIEKIAPLNQEITSFHSYLNAIEAFVAKIDIKDALSINNKLAQRRNPFLEPDKFTEEEKNICFQLQKMYEVLHFEIIGDYSTDRLHRKHKDLLDLVRKHLNKG